MNTLFDICVQILKIIAKITGMTYQEANIWIFVILHPLLTLVLFHDRVSSIADNFPNFHE
jgi:hypothetical protein